MLHRALFGSIERFFAVLLEHYAGAFPAWLAPVQAVGIPVHSDYDGYLPERFELEYTAADGTRQRPVMLHRALFGSIERFFAVLLEHYAGAFPAWLAPVQVVGIPVHADYEPYLLDVAKQLKAHGVRVEVDTSDDRMQKKIRNAQRAKVPFMLIAGEDDVTKGAGSFRYRDGTQENGVPVDDAVAKVVAAVASRG